MLIRTLSQREAYAEKARAALTRREPAIRDFFDIDHALRTVCSIKNLKLSSLYRRSSQRQSTHRNLGREDRLRQQLDADLKPVLRVQDFDEFDLERVVRILSELAGSCSSMANGPP